MSKAVLISINPEWCDLILRGDKTAEVRKTKPKLETPFKVYIYCTKAPKWMKIASDKWEQRSGKVVGEFICDKIWELAPLNKAPDDFEEMACLDRDEIARYLNKIHGYGWHISNFKIYDAPKEIYEFSRFGFFGMGRSNCVCGNWRCENYKPSDDYMITPICKIDGCSVYRPPQSWRYVEELHE